MTAGIGSSCDMNGNGTFTSMATVHGAGIGTGATSSGHSAVGALNIAGGSFNVGDALGPASERARSLPASPPSIRS
jgi:hypothetical protein